MAQPKNSVMTASPMNRASASPRFGGALIIVTSVLIGLLLAHFLKTSPKLALMFLGGSIAFSLAVVIRKAEYLFTGWIFLTTFVWLIMSRLMPEYQSIVGRGLFWGLLGCVIVAWAVDNVLRRRQFIPFDNIPLMTVGGIFLLWGVLTLLASQDVFVSLKKLSHVAIAFIVSYAFYNFFAWDWNNIRKVLKVVMVIIVAVSLLTIGSALDSLVSGVPIYKRISLWFWNPNSLGIFLFTCTPVLITAGCYFIRNRGIKAVIIGILFLALFFSFHRSSWVGAVTAIFLLLAMSRFKLPLWLAVVGGLFVSGLLFPVVGNDVYDYVTGERYTGRRDIWQASFRTACDHPILGTGPGTSTGNISEYMDNPFFKGEDTHSTYLKNAVEMGFPSVVIMLVFYGVFLNAAWRIERNLKSGYLKMVTRGAMATMFGLLFHGIFENGFVLTSFSAAEFTVMWPYIVIAMPFAAKKIEERREAADLP